MATTASPLPIIRPITDLRTHLNDVCSQATDTQEPVVLTKNGVGAYVLMDSNAYDAMRRTDRYNLAIREAEIEQRYNPDPISAKEADKRMKDIFQLWGIDYA